MGELRDRRLEELLRKAGGSKAPREGSYLSDTVLGGHVVKTYAGKTRGPVSEHRGGIERIDTIKIDGKTVGDVVVTRMPGKPVRTIYRLYKGDYLLASFGTLSSLVHRAAREGII